MDLDHSAAGLRQLSTAVFGMIVLTLGMGIGRFLYTPMLPVMLHEGLFTFSQLSLIASANYAGYLVGSLLFSFGIFSAVNKLRVLLLVSALLTVMLIFLMAKVTQPEIILLIRFLAGVASAGMMIFGSMLVLQHTHHPFVIASLFSGVGVGIFIGNEYVIAGVFYALNSHVLWIGAAIISAILFVILTMLLPKDNHMISPVKAAVGVESDIQWWNLALLYGLAGFGYIIVATYLPLMARGGGNTFLADHIWSIVGLAIIPGCYGWLWAARKWNILFCLSANLIVQASCVVMAIFINSPLLLTISCIGFGGTFMGTSSLVMPLARKISAPKKINLLGLVTLTYGIGQILGPLVVSVFQSNKNGMTYSILLGAVSLFIAAAISYLQYNKAKYSGCSWK
ncbi:MFS transporter [Citrobacter sp. Cu233]|uniref:MFS transporter n=1 Tax=Citrobacter sp. Cu233 TaxID=2985160 RepID=UPI002577B0C3|nr:MFS transporter [Citrobacter sp. Cu233]MDM2932106.1 MFS transporter [Citrobacter sp. Cu233]